MTTVQRVAQIFGIVFLIVGVVGFFSGSMSMAEGLLLGLFPVNVIHNVVHLLFGAWGLAASRSFGGAKTYAQIAGVIYVVLAIVGFAAPDLLRSIVPLHGNDVWLHALLGVALAAVGFTAKDAVVARTA